MASQVGQAVDYATVSIIACRAQVNEPEDAP